jgi:hypothetical protein
VVEVVRIIVLLAHPQPLEVLVVVVEQAIAILEVLETHLRQIPLKVMLVVMEHTVLDMVQVVEVVEQLL